ncbi:MAG: NAD(P)H-hydrate epimerase, partial [Bacteroidota bacterium]
MKKTNFPLANRAETVRMETTLIEEWGLPQLLLMERAALGVAEVVCSLVDPSVPVTALVGPGNNGADALAVCRLLHERGYSTRAFLVGADPTCAADRTETIEKQLRWLSLLGIPVESFDSSKRIHGVLLDGLFGFGLSRAPEGDFHAAIEWANAQDAIRVAIDLPSGILADTGTHPGLAIQADHTVACGTLKLGLVCDPALPFVGTLHGADIGFPPAFLEALPGRLLPRPALPPRKPWAHK